MAISTLKKRLAGTAAAMVLAAGTMAVATTDASAQYRYRHHNGGWNTGAGVAAGVVGGLALGALATGGYGYGGGYGPNYGSGYGYAPAYGGYGAYGGGCYVTRERVFDGYGWRIRRVRVCE